MSIAGCDSQRIVDPSRPADATPALSTARPPSVEVSPVNDEFDLPCGTFSIHVSYTGWVRTTTFFDQSATPVELRIQINVQGTATNLQTGKTVRDYENPIVVIDLTTGGFTINGVPAHVTAPGEGIIIQDTGRITYDAEGHVTFDAGPHDQGDQGPLEAYCSALS
jgi:hypothetical protein